VQASSAEEAFQRSSASGHGRTRFAEVDIQEIGAKLSLLAMQLVRVRENPALYGDKIEQFEEALAFARSMPKGDAKHFAQLLIMMGDARLDRAEQCLVLDAGAGEWLVFGVDIKE
jgi:hypothetical protein